LRPAWARLARHYFKNKIKRAGALELKVLDSISAMNKKKRLT
jgi:hypothetical protein